MTILPDFKTIHTETECETETDRLALRMAVRFGRPIALGMVVAIPEGWQSWKNSRDN